MKYNMTGDNLQFADIEIVPGETIYAEAGSMAYMTGNVSMDAKMRGGVFKGIKRKLTGESFFLTHFGAEGGPGVIAFAGRVPGKIMALDLRGGKQFILRKDSFLCAEDQVEYDIAFQKKLGAALFGGEGLILQRVWGEGTVFVNGCGDFVELNLQPGQMVEVSTSHAVGWETSVQYDIQSVGGITTAFFGGEGLFVTTLRGPGKVILQSLTLSKLANSLITFLPGKGDGGLIRIG